MFTPSINLSMGNHLFLCSVYLGFFCFCCWSFLIPYYLIFLCRPKIKIPAFVMMPIAHLVELTYKVLAPYGMKVPQLIPSRIRLLSLSRTFDCSKANELLGYTPIVPLQVCYAWTCDELTQSLLQENTLISCCWMTCCFNQVLVLMQPDCLGLIGLDLCFESL